MLSLPLIHVLEVSHSLFRQNALSPDSADAGFQNFVTGNETNRNSNVNLQSSRPIANFIYSHGRERSMRFFIPAILVLALLTSACSLPPEEQAVQPQPLEIPAAEPAKLADASMPAAGTLIEQPKIPEIIPSEAPTIAILDKGFSPKEITIIAGSSITWAVNDNKKHIIACYQNSKRLFSSDLLKPGDEFSKEFQYRGEVSCIDVIYGHRLKVTVSQNAPQELLSPTGYAVGIIEGGTEGGLIASIMLLGFFIVAGFSRKRRKR